MAERICEVSQGLGCPRKSREGWASVNKWIYLSNNTFNKWRELRAERDLASDNAVACYLLTLHEQNKSLRVPRSITCRTSRHFIQTNVTGCAYSV